MNWVNQVISAVEVGGKVAWTVLLFCSVVLALEYFFPELFTGLPDWVFPTILIIGSFSLVLFVLSITPPIVENTKRFFCFISRPMRRRRIRKKLLKLHVNEVVLLSKALAQSDREIWIKPDWVFAISLVDKGLIRSSVSWILPGDGTTSFKVPKEVWRVLLSMEEFKIPSPKGLLLALNSGQFNEEASILACLPQAHPAVLARTQQKAPQADKRNDNT